MNTGAALQFLIDTLFNLYAYIVFARFLLQLVRADFYNPLAQFVVKATNPLIIPLRRVIPGFAGLDIASLLLLVVLMLLKVTALTWVLGFTFSPLSIGIFSVKEVISIILNFFLFAIFIQVVLSWVSQGQFNPMYDILSQLTEPLTGPIRKIIPAMGGFDFTPMVAILFIYVIKILFGL